MFNMKALLETPAGPMATNRQAVPEGTYMAMLDAMEGGDPEKWMREPVQIKKEGSARKGQFMYIMRVPFLILDDTVKAAMKRDKVTVNMDVILDMELDPTTGEPTRLAVGEGVNVTLGQLRAAVGQNNDPTWTFAKLSGAGPLKVTVTHRADERDPTNKFAEVRRVAAVA